MTLETATCVPVADWVTLEDLDRDPYPIYARLREESPVAWVPAAGRFFLTRFADCRHVEADQGTFTAVDPGHRMNRTHGVTMLRKDDPEHADDRRAVNNVLRVEQAQKIWRPIFTDNARKLLAAFAELGPGADLNEDFAAPYAATNLAALVGLDGVDWKDVRRWSAAFIAGTANASEDPEVWRQAKEAVDELDLVLDELIPQLTGRGHPSILGAMLDAGLPEEAARANVRLSVAGGMNEPQHMITSGAWAFAQHPDQLRSLLADPSLYSAAFDEVARWLSPVGMVTRNATREVELGGIKIPAGSPVGASIQSANRDGSRFAHADAFDIHRDPLPHYAFGSGPHMCAGRWVAECAVGQVAWPMMYEMFDGLRPTDPATAIFRGWTFRGLESLPMTWTGINDPGRPGSVQGRAVLRVQVSDATVVADDVVAMKFVAPSGAELPKWDAGAHVTLILPDGMERQYSLCGAPHSVDPYTYRVAVLREAAGRGGSAHIHSRIAVGDELEIVAPRNHFPLGEASEYRFVAGGIGITPISAMISEAEERGAKWSLLYLGRSRERMAFATELVALYGDRVTVRADSESGPPDLALLIPDDTTSHSSAPIYACGPAPLLDGLQKLVDDRPGMRLHVERFTPVEVTDLPSNPFTVVLARSDRRIHIPPSKTIIEVLGEEGIDVLSSCMEGTCGTCETAVLAGTPCHRDSVRTREEQRSTSTMMICVSRANSPTLTLDL
ncbi:cytochrome P450 [Rhodococcus sp. NCIMB 12038]|uniref:cytochrome P450/oxidoreductase n=1 Tax=Rhodococcus sp. NCIMB 12038 TaxID=933800 RepID=UPI0015C5EF84|nr:cytochrome P450 [Rhodococcus sp. NCIMB 12038]